MRKLAVVPLIGAVVVGWTARTERDVVVAQARKPIIVTRLFTGRDGKTHVENTEVKLTRAGQSAPRAPDAEASDTVKVIDLRFRRTPANHAVDFHTAPQRQYVVTLSGRGEIELEDGTKIPLTPGHVLLAEDTTGKGHITRNVGSEDRLSLLIQLADR
jgi:hypothetical protein